MKLYFRICLLSPIWLPLLICAPVFALKPESGYGCGWLTWMAVYLGFSLMLGGVQYLIALVIVWRQIDFESVESILMGCLKLPLVFTPIQLIGMSLFLMTDGFEGLVVIFPMAAMDLLFGYGYVAVWLLGYGILALAGKYIGGEGAMNK